eukprot:5374_1
MLFWGITYSLIFINHALYTFWKYGDSSFNYGSLPTTQKLGYDLSPNIDFSTDRFPGYVDGASFVMTSDNNILLIGYDEQIVTLYKFDKCLSIQFKYQILSEVPSFLSMSAEGPYSIYQEYNNRKYLVQQFTFVNTETVFLLMVIEIYDNNARILWQFEHDRNGNKRTDIFYQHVVYKNYIFFQHITNDSYTDPYITRYVFDLNTGSILWKMSNTYVKYIYGGPPLIFENDNGNIIIIFDNSGYFHAIDMKTGDIIWNNMDYYSGTFIPRNTDQFVACIYRKYNLLFRACKVDWIPAVCVFNILTGDLITVQAHQNIHAQLKLLALNIRNNHSDFIIATENNVMYYNIDVNINTNIVTLLLNKNISKHIGEFYWIDSQSNIMFSIDYYYGNNCGKRMGNPRKLSREHFVLNKSGTQSNSVCTGFYGHYPIIENIQTMNKEQQYVYFISEQKLIAFTSTISIASQPYFPINYSNNSIPISQTNNVSNTSGLINSTIASYNNTQFVTTDVGLFCVHNSTLSIITFVTTSRDEKPDIGTSNSGSSALDVLLRIVVIVAVVISVIICIVCCFKYRNKLYELKNRCIVDNRNEPEQQEENNEFDYYPKKVNKVQVEKISENYEITKENVYDINKDDDIDTKEYVEMISKQGTLSYSAMNCVICLDILLEHESTKLICGHKFHTHCIEEYNETNKECPLCRKPIVFE